MPQDHGTDSITLVAEGEIEQLLEGWTPVYRERGFIVEDHLPVIGKHQHSAVGIIAQKN